MKFKPPRPAASTNNDGKHPLRDLLPTLKIRVNVNILSTPLIPYLASRRKWIGRSLTRSPCSPNIWWLSPSPRSGGGSFASIFWLASPSRSEFIAHWNERSETKWARHMEYERITMQYRTRDETDGNPNLPLQKIK
jgi:hypothetical protein